MLLATFAKSETNWGSMAKFIRPTHHCFDDALDFIEELAKQRNPMVQGDRLKVVHAICLAPDGHEYAHAWVEQDAKYVIFAGIMEGEKEWFAAEVGEYYAEHKVQETTKYTPKEALAENWKHETYGPWVERYKALCAPRQS